MPSSIAQQTALSIFCCKLVKLARENGDHPCHQVVTFQKYGHTQDLWQVPEPWRGDIEAAPLLFVSSNPSIDPLDDAPWNNQSDAAIQDYYCNEIISNAFPRSVSASGRPSKRPVSYWASLHKRAEEIFGHGDLRPGTDYALTEIVHCKSRDEYGVKKALITCAEQHLVNVLAISGAHVVVCFGAHAMRAVSKELKGKDPALSTPLVLELPHPNARTVRTAAVLPADQLRKARDLLRNHSRAD